MKRELKDIEVGSTDAKNELLEGNEVEKNRFIESFVIPPCLVISQFETRKKYFITGLKGTGKTALMRYLSITMEKTMGAPSDFILFKSDIDEDFKKSLSKAANADSVIDSDTSAYESDEFEGVWRWFVYNRIFHAASEKAPHLFEDNDEYKRFCAILRSPTGKAEASGLMRLIPAIKRGQIEISKDPKLTFEFDWAGKAEINVKFSELVRKADDAFLRLKPGGGSLNIFFDELELNYIKKSQYDRDSRLIRDLIVSIEKLNAKSKQAGIQIGLFAGIRSEVTSAIAASGKEINKSLADFGVEIKWNQPGLEEVKQPLLFVVSNRLQSTKHPHVHHADSENNAWDIFFPEDIEGKNAKEYLLHMSWYRPRDLVRMLLLARDQFPHEKTFSASVMKGIKKDYSKESWNEIIEELRAKYNEDDIRAIKVMLTGLRQKFSYQDLKDKIDSEREFYPEVTSFLDKHSLPEVLKGLYRIGAIGNYQDGGIFRFAFRGDDDLLPQHKMFIHNAIWRHLS